MRKNVPVCFAYITKRITDEQFMPERQNSSILLFHLLQVLYWARCLSSSEAVTLRLACCTLLFPKRYVKLRFATLVSRYALQYSI